MSVPLLLFLLLFQLPFELSLASLLFDESSLPLEAPLFSEAIPLFLPSCTLRLGLVLDLSRLVLGGCLLCRCQDLPLCSDTADLAD